MATPKDPSYRPPPGATLNEFGMWIMPSGDFAPGQDMSYMMAGATPAQQAAVPGPMTYDPTKKLYYRIIDGQRWYGPPAYDPARGTGQGPTDPGGGLIHGRAQWNPQTGQYDTPLDWGKILSMVAAGVITAGVADAALASTPALAATAPAGATATGVEAGATSGLGAATLPGAMATLPALGAAGAVSTIPATVAGAAGGASSEFFKTLLKALAVAAPAGVALAKQSSSSAANSPFTPEMQSQIQQLLQSQIDRSNRTTPIHQAAMAMASRMAPGYARGAMTAPSSPSTPSGLPPASPSVPAPPSPDGLTPAQLEALKRLMLGSKPSLPKSPDPMPPDPVPSDPFDPANTNPFALRY